jgi:hypothetical protein
MSSTGLSFARSLKRATDRTRDQMDAAVVGIVCAIAESLIDYSPVGNPALWMKKVAPKGYTPGTFRGNWQHGAGLKPVGMLPVADPSSPMTLARIRASVMENPRGKHYLVNNTPYARAIEYGHSTQAPHGVVALTQLRFPALVADGALNRTRSVR